MPFPSPSINPQSSGRLDSFITDGSISCNDAAVSIYVADFSRTRFPIASKSFSQEELERASRFTNPIVSQRYLAGRGILRLVLANWLDTEPSEVKIVYNPFGKPSLASQSAKYTIHFNLSHCEKDLVIAVCKGAPVGIDIETNRSLPDEASIVQRFFHPGEIEEYFTLPPPLRSQAFINAWTRKEAIVKAIGSGLSTNLDSFRVSLDPRLPAKIHELCVPELEPPVDLWTLRTFHPSDTTTASIAVPSTKVRISIHEIRIGDALMFSMKPNPPHLQP